MFDHGYLAAAPLQLGEAAAALAAARQREASLQVLDAQCRQHLGDVSGACQVPTAARPMLGLLVDDPEFGADALQANSHANACVLCVADTHESGGMYAA